MDEVPENADEEVEDDVAVSTTPHLKGNRRLTFLFAGGGPGGAPLHRN